MQVAIPGGQGTSLREIFQTVQVAGEIFQSARNWYQQQQDSAAIVSTIDRPPVAAPRKRRPQEVAENENKRADIGSEESQEEDMDTATDAPATEATTTQSPTERTSDAITNSGGTAPGMGRGLMETLKAPWSLAEPPRLLRTYNKRKHFCIPISAKDSAKVARVTINNAGVTDRNFSPYANDNIMYSIDNGYFMIPFKCSGMYMESEEYRNLQYESSMFRVVGLRVKMSNFATHSGSLISGSAAIVGGFSGIGWNSIQTSAELIGPYVCQKYTGATHKFATGMDIVQQFSDIIPNPGYKTYDFTLGQLGTLTGHKNGVYPVCGVQNIDRLSDFQFDTPKHTEIALMATERAWMGDARTITPFTYCAGVEESPFNKVEGGFTQDPSNEPHFLTDQSSNNHKVGDIIKPTHWGNSNTFNVMPQNAAPMSKFRYTEGGAAQNALNTAYGGEQTMGNATHHSYPDMWAVKPIVPPQPGAGDPNIMACFTLETELLIEYVPKFLDPSMQNMAYYGTNYTNCNIIAGSPIHNMLWQGLPSNLTRHMPATHVSSIAEGYHNILNYGNDCVGARGGIRSTVE